MKLKDICSFQSGGTPSKSNPAYFNGSIPWITTVSLNGKTIREDAAVEWITEQAISESAAKIVPANSIMVGTRVGVGKTAINAVPMSTSQDVISLIGIDESVWNKGYINKLIQSKSAFLNTQARGATIKGIRIEALAEIIINEISKEEQERIVLVMDSVQKIITNCKRELQAFEELIKARFVEMFGSFDLALQKPEWIPISQIGTVVGGSTPKTGVAEYWDGEYRWISPAELKADSGIIYDSVKKITKAGIDSCSLQELPVGTVILSSRAPIGKVAIAGNTFYCNQGFKNIICNENVLPRYLYTLLLFNTEYLNSLGRGATFKEISKSIVENIRIPLPTIEQQRQFEELACQVDKSKAAVQQALDKANLLFDSLMQKYFS